VTRIVANVGSMLASPIFVRTGWGRSNELASWDGIDVDFCFEDHLALLIDV
jgi:hypothetical protein